MRNLRVPVQLTTFQQGCLALAVGFFGVTAVCELADWVLRSLAR